LEATKDTDDSILALARSNTILGGLSSAAIERLLELGQPVEIGAQEVLVRQGDRSDCAYLILEGDLEVLVNTAYGEVLLARVSKGVLIGEIGVFADLPRNATVRARGSVRALRFERAHLLDAGDTNPALLRSVISRLGGQIGRFNNAIGLYTNAVTALEQDKFDLGILDALRQPGPELVDFAQHFRHMAEQIVQRRAQQQEMASAAAIQRAMLPSTQATSLTEGQFDIFPHMMPAREVGGDLYDIVKLDEDRIAITIGDVCGKGVPAALFMAVTQTVMRLVVRDGRDLQTEIERANDLLVANNREMMFATLFCGVLDSSSGLLTYCNCGHNPPLVVRKTDGRREGMYANSPPLGIEQGITYKAQSLALEPGDLVLLYTDGVTEAESVDGVPYGMDRLELAATELRDRSAREAVEGVVHRVADFSKGAPQFDDITCIALKRNDA
jgi:sigma-B regulation protein RsbU (phosphoserine phosphatase)